MSPFQRCSLNIATSELFLQAVGCPQGKHHEHEGWVGCASRRHGCGAYHRQVWHPVNPQITIEHTSSRAWCHSYATARMIRTAALNKLLTDFIGLDRHELSNGIEIRIPPSSCEDCVQSVEAGKVFRPAQ
jgi:hypothetical protein